MIKVLIVDDASFMRLALKRMLEHNGFQIVGEAENGVEAIKRYFECKPDIVTMDITMPGMTGIEALKLIKQKDPAAKVVMISAMGQEDMVRESVINGAITFIVKPFKEDTVVQILKQIGSI
jgi:two-component system chemotaxis response regulator CheY